MYVRLISGIYLIFNGGKNINGLTMKNQLALFVVMTPCNLVRVYEGYIELSCHHLPLRRGSGQA